MIYGKIINGELEYAPVNLKLDTGETIFNLNQRPDLLAEYGYKEVVTEYSEDENEAGVKDTGDKIVVTEVKKDKLDDSGDYVL